MKTIAHLSHSPGEFEKKYHPSQLIHRAKYPFSTIPKNKILTTKVATNEMLIFLVDDDFMFLKALEHSILSKLPEAKIQTFQTGEACLHQMTAKPQVVILDYFLDSKLPYAWNGFTILRQIKKLNSKTKVIMLSSQDSLDVAVKCIDNGSYDYITKSESAFVKINFALKNIFENIQSDSKGIKPYQIIIVAIIVILLIASLFK
jgi:two-component system OmpR family response regulator